MLDHELKILMDQMVAARLMHESSEIRVNTAQEHLKEMQAAHKESGENLNASFKRFVEGRKARNAVREEMVSLLQSKFDLGVIHDHLKPPANEN